MYMYSIHFCTLYTVCNWTVGRPGMRLFGTSLVPWPFPTAIEREARMACVLYPGTIPDCLTTLEQKAVRQNLKWKAWVEGYVYYVLVEHFWGLYILSFHSPVLQRVLVTPTSSPYPTWKICLQFSRKPDCRLLHHLHCPHLFHDCLIVWFNVTAAVSSSIDLYPWIIFLQRFIKILHDRWSTFN